MGSYGADENYVPRAVIIRFDGGQPILRSAILGDSYIGFDAPGSNAISSAELLEKISHSERLAVDATSISTNERVVAVFDLSGAGAAVREVRQSCTS